MIALKVISHAYRFQIDIEIFIPYVVLFVHNASIPTRQGKRSDRWMSGSPINAL